MLNFNDLEVQQVDTVKIEYIIKGRHIIGGDPFESAKYPGYNVFCIYDKGCMRTTMSMVTKKNFQEFLDWYLTSSIDRTTFSISYKFITNDGRVKTTSEIRNESKVGNKQFERNIAALQS